MEWFIKTNIFSQDIIIHIGAKYTDICGLRTHPLYNSYGIWYDISNWKYCKTIKKNICNNIATSGNTYVPLQWKIVGFGDIFLNMLSGLPMLIRACRNVELVMFMFNDINNNIPHFYIQLSLTKQLFGSVHSPVHCDTVYVVFLFSAKWLHVMVNKTREFPSNLSNPLHKQLILSTVTFFFRENGKAQIRMLFNVEVASGII